MIVQEPVEPELEVGPGVAVGLAGRSRHGDVRLGVDRVGRRLPPLWRNCQKQPRSWCRTQRERRLEMDGVGKARVASQLEVIAVGKERIERAERATGRA